MFEPGARSPSRRIAAMTGTLIVAVVLALGVTMGGAVPSRAATPAATGSPSPSPGPSAGASPSATASPSPIPSPLPSPLPTSSVGIATQPSVGLADGQFVKITLQNLSAGEAMFFRQCIATPASLTSDCTPVNAQILGRADAGGGGSTYFPVHASGSDLLLNGAGTAKIQCDNQHDCSVVAVTNFRHTYLARISFAPSPADCPAQGSTTPLGSGSAAATRAMYRWSASTCLPPRSLSVGYVTHNEHDAYRDFFGGTSDFGITGLRPPPAPSPSPSSSPQTYKLAPVSASAAVLAYRAYDTRGTQVTTLALSPDTIAALFMGQIANFSATPAITAINPGISFPPRSQVVARAEYNSETYILSSWLSAVAPNTWKPPASASLDIFPATGIDLKFGEQAAALDIINPPATGFDSQVVYIGLIDSSTAAFYGLPTVRIAMPDGSAVAATSDSILKGIAASQVAPDGTLIPQWSNTTDPVAYPMPMVTYMISPTNNVDPVKGEVIAKFLRYAVQDGQTLLTDLDGYARLPANLVQASLAASDLIPVPAPAPTPSPALTPIDTSTGLLFPPLTLPSLPPLPDLPIAPVAAGPATGGSIGASAPSSVVAALTNSQGIELVAAARDELGVPAKFALPSVVGLTLVLILGGLGLQLWVRRIARRRR